MTDLPVKPYHINAKVGDLNGRLIFLCGSDERAKYISTHFQSVITQESVRGHHLYLGHLSDQAKHIPVAAISTGMGCPSEDIILNELYQVGGRHFLRIGTAGSLQPKQIRVGDIVVASAAVRDEDTSACYIMPEFPAIASIAMINAINEAAHRLQLESVFTGIVHTKSSFYARELQASFLPENSAYLETLKKAGVLATEMECSQLFILGSLYDHLVTKDFHHTNILTGAILAIVGDDEPIHDSAEKKELAIKRAVELGLETAKLLADQVSPILKL